MLWHKTQGAGFGAAVSTAIEDVFSTYLYTGNGLIQTITNGIDLAGEGGMVWFKGRDQVGNHLVYDTERGAGFRIQTDQTNAQTYDATTRLTSFTSSGFTLGNLSPNTSGINFVSWTWRKAPRWFDVVTFSTTTGSSTPIAVSHNLGTTPGCIIVKQTNAAADWFVYHRSLTSNYYLSLNSTDFQQNGGTSKFYPAPNDTSFYLGGDFVQNGTYVAYLFAHDPLGPSGDGSDGLIACGSWSGNGSDPQSINLGWEPQFVMFKSYDTSGTSWFMYDNMRGVSTSGADQYLSANYSSAEASSSGLGVSNMIEFTPTGFNVLSGQANFSGRSYIYIAIRRGPMREPTSGTEVFDAELFTAGSTVFQPDFPPDMNLHLFNRSVGGGVYNGSRMTGNSAFLVTSSTGAEGSFAGSWKYDGPTGTFAQGLSTGTSSGGIQMMFRRAPGFFDVVAYQGNNVAGRTVPHNLGVAPEMMIVKCRSAAFDWIVWHEGLSGNTYDLVLNTVAAEANFDLFSSTAPDASNFYLGTNYFDYHNASTRTYIAYLFATLPGVSKVGSYTGNGSSQTIDCGFTGGARFVLIKRTDSTGDWYVWDTARGIVTGNDPFLELNTTDAEVTSDDSIDPDSSGFIVNQTATTNVNVSSASYIYLAIA